MNQSLAIPHVYKAVNSILTSLSSHKDIKIVFSGRPCTDGKTVYLGEPPVCSTEALDAYLAHGTHEIHHVLYTSFEGIAEVGPLFPLVNALEDVRIDSIGYRAFPGTYYWREKHLERLKEKDMLPEISESLSPAALLCLTLFWNMTHIKLSYSVSEHFARHSREIFIRHFGEKLYEKVHALALKAVNSSGTSEVIEICREIAREFCSFSEGVGKTENNSANESREEKSTESSPKGVEAVNHIGESSAEDGEGVDSEFAKLFMGENPESVDMHKVSSADARSHQKKEAETGLESVAVWPVRRSEVVSGHDRLFEKTLEEQTSLRASRFRRFLNASVYIPSNRSRQGNRILPSALAGLSVGDDRVFTTDAPAKRPSAAFSILIDRSGSMDRETMRTAAVCGYLLADLIDSVKGCCASATAFPGTERHTLLEVKSFAEKATKCRHRFMGLRSFGYTPVCQSLNSVAAQLFGRREERKIIFMITDGLCSEEGQLKAVSERLQKAGIEIICLGIGSSSPIIFQDQINIKNSCEMPEALYQLLERSMKKSFNS